MNHFSTFCRLCLSVGMARFELTTSASQMQRSKPGWTTSRKKQLFFIYFLNFFTKNFFIYIYFRFRIKNIKIKLLILSEWWDSNPHALRHQILNLACLPFPAHSEIIVFMMRSFSQDLFTITVSIHFKVVMGYFLRLWPKPLARNLFDARLSTSTNCRSPENN